MAQTSATRGIGISNEGSTANDPSLSLIPAQGPLIFGRAESATKISIYEGPIFFRSLLSHPEDPLFRDGARSATKFSIYEGTMFFSMERTPSVLAGIPTVLLEMKCRTHGVNLVPCRPVFWAIYNAQSWFLAHNLVRGL